MQIEIAARLCPYTFLPAQYFLIPASSFVAQIFPALVRLFDVSDLFSPLKEIPLDIRGPLKHFMVVQDTERGVLSVFSESFRYHITSKGELVWQKKAPLFPLPDISRLSLGSHRQLLWPKLHLERDFQAIFPLWHRLGSLIGKNKKPGVGGPFSLLKECQRAIDSNRPETIVQTFTPLFLAGFKAMMVPRLWDDDYQGIIFDRGIGDPLFLLQEGARLIESLFVALDNEGVHILPHLPPEFFAGRFINVEISGVGRLDILWSKKMIRMMRFYSYIEAEIPFIFPAFIRSFRFSQATKHSFGRFNNRDAIAIKPQILYFLDQFQK